MTSRRARLVGQKWRPLFGATRGGFCKMRLSLGYFFWVVQNASFFGLLFWGCAKIESKRTPPIVVGRRFRDSMDPNVRFGHGLCSKGPSGRALLLAQPLLSGNIFKASLEVSRNMPVEQSDEALPSLCVLL